MTAVFSRPLITTITNNLMWINVHTQRTQFYLHLTISQQDLLPHICGLQFIQNSFYFYNYLQYDNISLF